MILLRLRSRLGRLLSLSPTHLLPLSPLVVWILTVSTVPLLSSEWEAREDLGDLVGPPGGLGGMGYRRASARHTPVSNFLEYSSNNDYFRSYTFPHPIPDTIPPVVFHHHGAPPPPGVFVPSPTMGYHHGPASVASVSAFAASPRRPLSHDNFSESSASELTMSFPPQGGVPTAVPLAQPPAPPHVPAPPPVMASGGVRSPPPVSSPPLVVTPPTVPL